MFPVSNQCPNLFIRAFEEGVGWGALQQMSPDALDRKFKHFFFFAIETWPRKGYFSCVELGWPGF